MSFEGFVRQSTAVGVIIGPFVDATDGDTEETALTIAQADVRLSKNAGADAQKNDATTCAHEGDGFYMCELDATDTNTVGHLVLWVHVAGALAVRHTYCVLEEAVYDRDYAAAATGAVAVSSIAAGAITAAAIATDAIDDDAIATGAIASTAFAAGAINAAAIAADAIGASELAADAVTEIAAPILAVLGALADAAADGDVTSADSVMAYVKQIVNTLVTTVGIPTFPAAATPGNAVSLAEVVRQIYDEVAGLNGGVLLDAAGVRSAVGLASANLDTQLGALPTAAENADAVWDELLAGHLGAGSTGEALGAAGSAGDPWVTALPGAYSAGQAGNIVGNNLNATVGSRATQTSVDTIDDLLDTEVAAIKAKTDNLPVDPADQSAVEAAITAAQTAILADTDDIQARLPAALVSGRMDASVGAMAADVLTAAAIAGDAATEIAMAVWAAGTRTLTAIASGVLSSAALNDIADSLLDRNMATGTDSGSTSVRTVRQALRALRNRVAVAAGTATVYKENDVSVSWSAAVTTTAGDPISEIDPAGP